MTDIEAKYFKALHEQRKEIADVLNKPAARGAKDRVADQYSEQAHFIYELLQNADDAGATRVRFVLDHERLVFVHNGTRHFSLSDPDNEEVDGSKGRLGDINAITSIGNSNKKESSIGKFGVGFKSVFQYTDTPEIYDKKFRFKIEEFLVPCLLTEDFPGRKNDETVFVFPLKAKGKNSTASYNDISSKLESLNYPLLFLSTLSQIDYKAGETSGSYTKEINFEYDFPGTKAGLVSIMNKKGTEKQNEKILVFSRGENSFDRYSVGFFLDTDKSILKPKKLPAFCFFPTREATGLNFIIHAPFLLNQSREGLKVNDEHNSLMISNLAILASDSLEYLIKIEKSMSVRYMDDSILNILPYNIEDEEDKVSFYPFYKEVIAKYQHCKLLPTQTGYTTFNHAYWASTTDLPTVFNADQLSQIVKNRNSHWVFVSKGRNELYRNNQKLAEFIDRIVNIYIDEKAITDGRDEDEDIYDYLTGRYFECEAFPGITERFIEAQPMEWLFKFYSWINLNYKRRDTAKKKSYFLDSNRKALPLFDANGNEVLFLPVKGLRNFHCIHPDLIANPDCKRFFEEMGIKKPSMLERIRLEIIPQYDDEIPPDVDQHFMMFFNYFCECPTADCDKFVDLISPIPFLASTNESNYGNGVALFYPYEDLKEFFSIRNDVDYLDLPKYQEMVGKSNQRSLSNFLLKLGVKQKLAVEQRDLNKWDYSIRRKCFVDEDISTVYYIKESYVFGLAELVSHIEENKDKDRSLILWKALLSIVGNECTEKRLLDSVLCLSCSYKWYRDKKKELPGKASDFVALVTKKWLINKDGDFVSVESVDKSQLADCYDKESANAQLLIRSLGIVDEKDSAFLKNMSEKERELYLCIKKGFRAGVSAEKITRFIESCLEEKSDGFSSESGGSNEATATIGGTVATDDDIQTYTDKVINDIRNKAATSKKPVYRQYSDEKETCYEEYAPKGFNYSKRIEKEKKRSAVAIENIAYMEELQNAVMNSEKYSYLWFKNLLELEIINPDRATQTGNEISISFDSVTREEGAAHTLILRDPDRGIPQVVEEMTDIPLELTFKDGSQKVLIIDGASVHSFTMRVKIRKSMNLLDIDLSAVINASIATQNPVFLLGELKKGMEKLGYDDDYNLKTHLTNSIEFVFGPPGTGKTTYLAQKVISRYMSEQRNCRVLVLAPTNKAADVLVERIIGLKWKNREYENWLCRFGTTSSERIGDGVVFKDKDSELLRAKKNVTVTTIHRFPYDYYLKDSSRLFLRDQRWDYVVIDEASMIPLVYIIYVLYRVKAHFIIAGDPFQIEPIAKVDTWKDENIYKMVKLNSFTDPKTEPISYPVTLLTEQYRSIPTIGSVFSRFAYGGVLQHHRLDASAKTSLIAEGKSLPPLSIISFPVSRFDSIYKAKQIERSSPYQIYSALLMYECVTNLAHRLAENNPGKEYSIGVIAPYRAESDLISKLIQAEKFPSTVKVAAGTIHGFQGDECDIVFVVLNTPPSKMESSAMFLNKINILNVAISRARDHLILVMPDENTENIENLHQVERLKSILLSDECLTVEAKEIEKYLFGTSNYLEMNSFVTGHQSVNVYGIPEREYEIRVEDNAVDVQIHRNIQRGTAYSGETPTIPETNEIQKEVAALSDNDADSCEETETDESEEVMDGSTGVEEEYNVGDGEESSVKDPSISCADPGVDIEDEQNPETTTDAKVIVEANNVINKGKPSVIDHSLKPSVRIELSGDPGRTVNREGFNLLSKKQKKAAFLAQRKNKPIRRYWIVPGKKKPQTEFELNHGKLSFEINDSKCVFDVWYSGLNLLIFISSNLVTKEIRKAFSNGFTLTRIDN